MRLRSAWHAAAGCSVGSTPTRQAATAAELSFLQMRSGALRLLLHLSWCTGCGILGVRCCGRLQEIDVWEISHLLRWRVFPHDLLHLRVQWAAELLAHKVAKGALVACVLLRGWCQAMFDSVCPMYSMLNTLRAWWMPPQKRRDGCAPNTVRTNFRAPEARGSSCCGAKSHADMCTRDRALSMCSVPQTGAHLQLEVL